VFPVKTNAIKAWRESEVVSGAKSDAGDAEVIADYLRIRRHRLRALDPFSDATKALRAVVRARTDLVEQRVAAANQLTATLDAFWPGAKAMFSDITCNIALTFLETYPTPAAAAPLGEGNTASAQGDVVLAMVRVIRALNQSIKDLDRSLNARLDEHPDAAIFTSLPRSGRINAAQMLAEWGDSRQAYDSPGAIAALSGAAPVTKRSGKHHVVSFRWACNKRLRNAFATFADNSRHASPWAADVYARARARGHDHPHAIRILARAWIRIIWRCWIDQVPYDPTRHGAARAFAERDLATGAAA
jgi:transposase